MSPDGGYLAYVTLNSQGDQTGVAIEQMSASGRRTGPIQHLPTTSVPPSLPITRVAVASKDEALAVSGGFVDPYLGARRPTVGTLTPISASSLAALVPVFDAEGIPVPPSPNGRPQHPPQDWQSSPVYLANGELLVGDHNMTVSMPFSDTGTSQSGGGIRTIVHSAGRISSLAAGAGGSLAWVAPNGKLHFEANAVNLPLGPTADTPPMPDGTVLTATGRYESVTWTGGFQDPATTAPPPTFQAVSSLPNVVGMTEAAATQAMTKLALPVFVASTVPDASVPAGTVLAQSPAAGTAIACQCAIGLTVSAVPDSSGPGRPSH